MERENPMFKEAVKLGLTPMLSSLAIMENAEFRIRSSRTWIVSYCTQFGNVYWTSSIWNSKVVPNSKKLE